METNQIMDLGASGGTIMLPAHRTPVYRTVDVVVCGGGMAGAVAAIEAARAGADTLLIERNVVLGGRGPLAFDIAIDPDATGVAGEVVERLLAGGQADVDRIGGGLVYDPESLKYALLDLAREAGVQILLSTWVADPIKRDGVVRGVAIENKSGRFAVLARTVVDATGDGELALRSGGRAEESASRSLTLNLRIGGVDFARALAGRAEWVETVRQAKRDGRLSAVQPDDVSLYGLTPLAESRGIAFIRGPRVVGATPWEPESMTNAERDMREGVAEFLSFLKTLPGFETAFLIDAGGALATDAERSIICEDAGADDASPLSGHCRAVAGVRNLLLAGTARVPALH